MVKTSVESVKSRTWWKIRERFGSCMDLGKLQYCSTWTRLVFKCLSCCIKSCNIVLNAINWRSVLANSLPLSLLQVTGKSRSWRICASKLCCLGSCHPYYCVIFEIISSHSVIVFTTQCIICLKQNVSNYALFLFGIILSCIVCLTEKTLNITNCCGMFSDKYTARA